MRFLFWNIGGNRFRGKASSVDADATAAYTRQILDSIEYLAKEHDIDCFIFSEAKYISDKIQKRLYGVNPKYNSFTGREFLRTGRAEQCNTIFYATFDDASFRQVEIDKLDGIENEFNTARLHVRQLDLTNNNFIWIAGVHLCDKRSFSAETQEEEARRIARRLRYMERTLFPLDQPRTLLAGDFNMNPFERGMMLPQSFYAIPWPGTTVVGTHLEIQGTVYPYFLNATFTLYNDSDTTNASYLFSRQNHDDIGGLHYYDQVLVRPALINIWQKNSLRLITRLDPASGGVAVLKEKIYGRTFPAFDSASDHLPLMFELDAAAKSASR